MRHVLELCVAVDELAEGTYRQMAAAVGDDPLAAVFMQMSAEESGHADWWRNLLAAWDDGLLPDTFNDSVDLEAHLEALRTQIETLVSIDPTVLSPEDMLDVAVRMEFFMLDPVFSEMLDLAEPARAEARRQAYANHVERVVTAVQDRYGCESLTGFLASVLRRTWRDNVMLATHATHDPLTSLHNRRALDSQLRQWSAWSQRYGRPLSVMLVDVDDFKQVNDTFGHVWGDRALKAIATTLQREMRGADLVARYGGDEFVVVAPELEADEFEAMCNRIVRSMRALAMADERGRHISISVSVGGVVASPRIDGVPSSPEELLAAADRSLYAAKRAGKDRAAVPLLLDASVAV